MQEVFVVQNYVPYYLLTILLPKVFNTGCLIRNTNDICNMCPKYYKCKMLSFNTASTSLSYDISNMLEFNLPKSHAKFLTLFCSFAK